MITKDEALRIIRERSGREIKIYAVTEKPKDSWHIYEHKTFENCWFINYSFSDNESMVISTRLMIISKDTGEVLHDGSAYDERA